MYTCALPSSRIIEENRYVGNLNLGFRVIENSVIAVFKKELRF